MFNFLKPSQEGRVKQWMNNGFYCRALVADSGKIISAIDSWDSVNSCLANATSKCKMMQTNNGIYLIEPNKRFEIPMKDCILTDNTLNLFTTV